MQAIQRAAEAKFGDSLDLSSPRKFQFSPNNLIEFQPSEWEQNGWSVFATDGNDVMLYHTTHGC